MLISAIGLLNRTNMNDYFYPLSHFTPNEFVELAPAEWTTLAFALANEENA